MPSGNLSFERVGKRWLYPALYRKNLKRFWPVWASYLAIWVVALPLYVLTSAQLHYAPQVLDSLSTGIALSAFWGLFSAMAVFSYLYNPKAAGTLHALPVRREGLFLTNWLSGLSFLVLPHAAVFLLTMLVQTLVGQLDMLALVLWLLSMCLTCLFFYSFAVFCAMFTGNLVALPVFYGILNFLAIGLAGLFQTLMGQFLFGFNGTNAITDFAFWFTPVLQLYRQVYTISRGGGAGPLHGFAYILLYAAVGVVFTVLALLVYRRRHLETAGDVVSVSWVRPIFKYGVAFCAAVAFGTVLYSFLFGSLPDNVWAMLAFLLLWGAVGYFAAEMLLRKSFRVFKRSWKGACAFSLALLVGCCVLEFDVTGFERRVPDPATLSQASIRGFSAPPYDSFQLRQFTDPEDLAALTRLHAAITERKDELESESIDYFDEPLDPLDPNGNWVTLSFPLTLVLEYQTLDGRLIGRTYSIPVTQALLDDPDSPAARLTELINRPTVVDAAYFGDLPEDAELIRASVDTCHPGTGEFTDQVLTGELLSVLLAAVRSDIAAGRLGRNWLIRSRDMYDICYSNELTLTFYYTYTDEYGKDSSLTSNISICLQTTATDTIQTLERLGLVDRGHVLLTIPQQNALRHAEEQPVEYALYPSTTDASRAAG